MSELTPQEDVQEIPPIPPPIQPPPRNILGWAFMWLLFALMFAGQMWSTYSTPATSASDEAKTDAWKGDEVAAFRLSTAGRVTLGTTENWPKEQLSSLEKQPMSPARSQIELIIAKEFDLPAPKEAAEYLAAADKQEAAAFTALLAGEKPKAELTKTDEFLEDYATALGKGKRKSELLDEIKSKSGLPNVAFFGGALLLLGAGSLGSIVFFAATARSQPPPANSFPARGVSKPLSDVLATRMVVYILSLALVPTVVITIIGPSIYSTAFAMALVGVSLALFSMRGPLPLRQVIGSTKNPLKLIGLGIGGWLAAIPAMMIFAVISSFVFSFLPTPSHPVITELLEMKSMAAIVTTFVTVALIVPIVEELAFRGTFFPALMAYMKPVTAMCVGGLIFAMIHPQGIILWLSLGSLGAMASYLYYRTGSLIPSITLHIANNFMILMLQQVMNG